MIMDRAERLKRVKVANQLIKGISECGRNFFRNGEIVAYLKMDSRGRIWCVDEVTQKEIYTHHKGPWRNYTGGGTLRRLVEQLRDYIAKGTLIPAGVFGPWPFEYGGGDPWGYGADMEKIRDLASDLEIVEKNESKS